MRFLPNLGQNWLTRINPKRVALMAGSGLLCALAFPNPLNINFTWPGNYLAWIALIPLFCLNAKTWQQAAGWGLGFGLIYFGGSIVWMAFMPALGPLAPGVWMLLSLYLAFFTAVFMVCNQQLLRRGFPVWSSAPALWVSLEFLRNYALSGFPWAILGAAQYRHAALMSLVSFSGVWGLSWLTVLVNALLFSLLAAWRPNLRPSGQAAPGSNYISALAVSVMAIVLVGGGLYEHHRLTKIPDKAAVTVAALQGNIDQNQSWDEHYRRETLNRFFELGSQAHQQKAELLIWPESAFPGIFNWDQALASEVRSWSRTWQIDQIVSSDTVGQSDIPGEFHYFNTMLWVDPNGLVTSRFSKIHLVPFGEFIPFKSTLLFFVRKLVPRYENGEFTPGERRQPLIWSRRGGETRVGGLICFESIFPQYASELVRQGSELLVVVTYDAWFGVTAAPAQHAIFSALRAAETDRYIIHNAATGVSAAFDPQGRLLGQVALNTPGVLLVKVGLRNTQTFFVRFGPWLPWVSTAWVLLLFVLGAYRARDLPSNVKTKK